MAIYSPLEKAGRVIDMEGSFKCSIGDSAGSSPKCRIVGPIVVLDSFAVAALIPNELTISI